MRNRRRGHDDVLELVDLGPSVATLGAPVADGGGEGPGRAGVETFVREELSRMLVLARVLSDAGLADVVAQRTMLAVAGRWDPNAASGDPTPGSRALCVAKASAALRRRRWGQRLLGRLGLVRTGVLRPVDAVERFWLDVRVLPRPQPEAMALHHALALPVEDVAAVLGCGPETARGHLEEARARLGVGTVEADDLGRATRDAVGGDLDPDAFLAAMAATRVRRQRSVATAGSAVVGVGVAAVALSLGSSSGAIRPVSDAAPAAPTIHCEPHPAVRCLTATEIIIRGEVSYRFNLPPGFSDDLEVTLAPGVVDVYQDSETAQGGVTILERVAAVDRARKQGLALGAKGLARWVASRPFLAASRVRRDTLGNRVAWTVEVRLDPRYRDHPPGFCNGAIPCFPLLRLYPNGVRWETGIWNSMLSRYTFSFVPGLGTVAVWSWAFNLDRESLAKNDALVSSLVL